MRRTTIRTSTFTFCVVVLLCAACARVGHIAGAEPTAPVTIPQISAELLRTHVSVLANDSMEGRGVASAGYLRSAKYVAAQFAAVGLKPVINGRWYQSVPLLQQSIASNRARVSFSINNTSSKDFQHGADFVNTQPGPTTVNISAPVVFVGYGITLTNGSYDDYKNLDVRGKIVAFLPGTPKQLSLDERTFYSGTKEKNATQHGAIGTLRIWTPDEAKTESWSESIQKYQNAGMFSFVVPESAAPDQRHAEHIWLGPDASEALFAGSPITYQQATALAAPMVLTSVAHIAGESNTKGTSSPNVLGMIPGTDRTLKNEYIVISAHLDHLGIGPAVNGDSIYNGAVDNAAGVAALIEVARARLQMKTKSRRSILFIAFTGEEPGGLGSDYFVNHSPVPLSSIVANINLDAISVWDYDGIVPRGAEHSSLATAIDEAVALVGARVVPDPIPGKTSLAQSDQYAFMTSGIPAVIPATARSGKAREAALAWVNTRYHQPSDDLQQPLDFEAASRFSRVILSMTYVLGNETHRPTWNSDSFFRQFSTPSRHN